MTLARGVFAALVLATFAAFFVAQELKSTPPVIHSYGVFPFFSPNKDSRFERAPITFALKRRDRVRVTIIDDAGDEVRTLFEDRPTARRERVRTYWDGLDERGRRAPDGEYRVQVVLRGQGRSVTVPRTVTLDTTPPRPRVLSIGPEELPGAELLPRRDGRPAQIRISAPGRKAELEVWRTDRGPRLITALRVPPLDAEGEGVTSWDGTARGRPVGGGSFAVVVRSRDRAGNIGTTARGVVGGEQDAFALRRGERLPGAGGIAIRYLGVQAPVLPVRAGSPIQVAVDARGAAWNWSLRRAGAPQAVRRGRRTRGGPFTVKAPDGESGLFLFEVRTRQRSARVPVVVDGRRSRKVLVIAPATTWQGLNPIDDDGDGLPNVLSAGLPASLDRVYARDGLPTDVATREAPIIAHLDRQRHRYDFTTDVALAAGRGPKLAGHSGVLIAGNALWLTPEVRRGLRTFVAGGGELASLGVDSLLREVKQEPRRLVEPTPRATTDLFGSVVGRVDDRTVELSIFRDDERLKLFAGGNGLFRDVKGFEPTREAGREARIVSTAATPGGRPVLVALRFGKGLVIRPGMPTFAQRLSRDTTTQELMGRIWTLLETG